MKKAAGFTLIELLLVLVLIGIGTGLAIVSVDRLAGRAEERRWIDRTQQELRKLRNKAVLGAVAVRAELHFDTGLLISRSQTLLELPDRFHFESTQAAVSGRTQPPESTLALVFYPDGTMQDARFRLRTPSGLRQEFRLAQISGRIEKHDVTATAE